MPTSYCNVCYCSAVCPSVKHESWGGGVFSQDYVANVVASTTEDDKRTVWIITFQVTQIHQRNRQTDGETDRRRITTAMRQWKCQCQMYRVGHKNVALYFCPYFRQLLVNFLNSFTGTLCRQFAITRLLRPTTPSMRLYTTLWNINEICIYNDNNKQTFWQNWKKTLQTNIAVNGLYDTKLCWSNCLTQSSVIRIIHRNVGVICFTHLPKFLLLSLVFAYIFISQGSVETHLSCGWIYNNCIIANCLQSVSMKEFWKSVNNWRRRRQKLSATFLWLTV